MQAGRSYRVDPVQPRISDKSVHSTVRRVENRDSIRFHVCVIDETIRIRLHAI
jgi:hypothetical protein